MSLVIADGLRNKLFSVSIDNQHHDPPDLNLPHHAGNNSRACISNYVTGGHGAGRNPPIGPDVVSGYVHARVRRLEWQLEAEGVF